LFPTTPKEKAVVTEEVQYIFTVSRYRRPVVVEPIAREDASYDKPERTAISVISAMAAGDHEWWLSAWSEGARAALVSRDAAEWAAELRQSLAGRVVTLTHRIETGPYVIIAYLAEPEPVEGQPVPAKVWPHVIVTRQYDDRWLATDELDGDPVVTYWARPGARHRRIER
jgi:hypothetical protein